MCVALSVYVGAVGVMAVSNLTQRERALAVLLLTSLFSGKTRVLHFDDFAAKF